MKKFKVKFNLNGSQRETEVRSWSVNDAQKLVREQYVSWKKTLQCNRCGFNDYRALQFHHERDKEHNIAEMLRCGFALEKIKIEAEKCEVLCANCHQIHHSRL